MSGEAPDQPKDLSQAEIDAAMNQAASDAPTAGVPKDDATSKPAAASDASSKQSDDSSQPEVIAADDASADASTADDTPTAEPLKLDATGRPFDDIAVGAAVAAGSAPLPPPPANSVPLELPDFGRGGAVADEKGLDLLNDVALNLKIELGRSSMCIEDVLKLGEGSIVELDKLAGDPVDVFVNERLIARGEVLVLNDNFCVRVSEIVSNEEEVTA
jgi:flagellar motor switch protein FliN/FliY